MVVMMLVTRAVTTHLVYVCAARPAPRRARERTDEGRAVRVGALHGHGHGCGREGAAIALANAGASYCVGAARARDTVMVLSRCDEVKRRTLLAERWRRRRGRFLREAAWARSRGRRGQRDGRCG